MKIILIASSGGHFLQLYKLNSLWKEYERVWVTFNREDTRHFMSDPKENIVWAYYPTNRNIWNLIRNLLLAYKTIRLEKPDVLISTGAGVAVPFLLIGKIFGINTIYIESLTRTKQLSLTGRFLRLLTEHLLVQWKNMTSVLKKSVYFGNVLDLNGIDFKNNELNEQSYRKNNITEAFRNKKIFVTAGLEKYSFDRLFSYIDFIVEKNIIDPIYLVCQKGATRYIPKRYAAFDFLSFNDMITNIKNADITISHAGVGTLLLCLHCGKIPIIMPRQRIHKEHVDDHQLEFCKSLDILKRAIIVYDKEQLTEAIINYTQKCNELDKQGHTETEDMINNIRNLLNAPGKKVATKMRIAFIGTRGIPAAHGGFETCVEELGYRLIQKGHELWVYSKKSELNKYTRQYKGMRIVKIPRLKIKGFETLFSTILSVFHSLFYNFDIHMIFNGANSPALIIYKLFKTKYALNTDGLEWKREKWGFLGRNYYKLSERISVLVCKNLVSDSQGIHDYYKSKYKVDSTIIAYGADIPPQYPAKQIDHVLHELGIERKKYLLQVTRFEPENHPQLTLQSFNAIKTDLKCVVVGGANYRSSYLEKIEDEERKNENIILPGFIYHKEKLDIIWQNAYCYIHGNSVGGTNPALLQAMAAGRPIISIDCRFNRDTLGEQGYFYAKDIESLCRQINYVIKNKEEAERRAQNALERIKSLYTWDKITDQYEAFFNKIVNG